MKRFVYAMIIVLAVVHQDFWWWHDSQTLVFSFLPVGLAYHAGISIAAAVLWALAVKYCWPADVDADDGEACGTGASGIPAPSAAGPASSGASDGIGERGGHEGGAA